MTRTSSRPPLSAERAFTRAVARLRSGLAIIGAYFAFPEPQVVASFVLGDPPTLQLGNRATEEAKLIASSIGRSIQKIPGRAAASFLHKIRADDCMIKQVGAEGLVMDIARAPKGREDYTWFNDKTC